MTKILNNRPLFYCFLAFGFGILLAKPIFSLDIVICFLTLLCFFAVALFCIKFKKIVSILLIFISFMLGIASFFISCACFNPKDYGDDLHTISGRIAVVNTIDSNQSVILDNVYISGEKIGESINVFIYNCNEMEEGTIISFNSIISANTLFTLKSFNSYNYKYNVQYSASANLEDVTVVNMNNLSYSERLKISIKKALFKNMDYDGASVSYASLFGDKTFIETSTKSAFSVSGIAHLLAVSGLHVGFLVSFLTYLLKKLKANKYCSLGIVVGVLCAYCYLCSFSVSVIRASVMFLIMGLSKILGKKYDRLNSWGFAGIVCLLYKPLSVYDGGFLLSFACVLCIFMFARPLAQKFESWHFNKKIASTLGVMLPIQFGLLPLVSLYYTEVSLLSVVANFICVPLFQFFFTALFAILPIVLILPFMSFMLFVPNFLIGIVIYIAKVINGLDFAIIKLTMLSGIVVILVYLLMFIFSHYLNLKPKYKIIASFALVLIGLMGAILSSYPLQASNNKITVLNKYDNVYIVEQSGVSFAIGNFNSSNISLTQNYLNLSRLYSVDYFISLNSSIPNDNNKPYFKNIYSCQNQKFLINGEVVVSDKIKFYPTYVSNNFVGLILKADNQKILFCSNESLTNLQYAQFAQSNSDITLIVGDNSNINNFTQYINVKNVLKDGKTVYNSTSNKSFSFTGNWTFNLKQDKILNVRGVD